MNWQGKVFSGDGDAAEFVSLKPYNEFIQDFLGYEPFPGTLNLRGSPDSLKDLKRNAESARKESFRFKGDEFGGVTLYRIEINSSPAAILDPDLSRYGEKVAEVVSETCLREDMNLKDGDKVSVSSDW